MFHVEVGRVDAQRHVTEVAHVSPGRHFVVVNTPRYRIGRHRRVTAGSVRQAHHASCTGAIGRADPTPMAVGVLTDVLPKAPLHAVLGQHESVRMHALTRAELATPVLLLGGLDIVAHSAVEARAVSHSPPDAGPAGDHGRPVVLFPVAVRAQQHKPLGVLADLSQSRAPVAFADRSRLGCRVNVMEMQHGGAATVAAPLAGVPEQRSHGIARSGVGPAIGRSHATKYNFAAPVTGVTTWQR